MEGCFSRGPPRPQESPAKRAGSEAKDRKIVLQTLFYRRLLFSVQRRRSCIALHSRSMALGSEQGSDICSTHLCTCLILDCVTSYTYCCTAPSLGCLDMLKFEWRWHLRRAVCSPIKSTERSAFKSKQSRYLQMI
jgi:hypothetical protein